MDDTSGLVFNGFEVPVQNWSMLPHSFIDALPIFSSMAEMKVVMYTLRHTWGYREYEQAKTITLDEFTNGRKHKDGTRIDHGTGLAKSNVIKGLKKAVEHGFLAVGKNDKDIARRKRSYRIRMASDEKSDVSNQDIRGIESGHRTEKETLDEKLNITVASPPLPSVPKTPQPSKSQTVRKLPITDPLFKAIDREFFGGAGGSNPIVAAILNGREKQHLPGLIKSEMERQHKTKEQLDFNALALMVPKFKESLPVDSRTGKTIELRDPIKYCVRWDGWRNTTNHVNCPPVIFYNPDCPHKADPEPCEEGWILTTKPDGERVRIPCECQMKIRKEKGLPW